MFYLEHLRNQHDVIQNSREVTLVKQIKEIPNKTWAI